MRTITEDFINDYDEHAEVKGLIQSKRCIFYDTTDQLYPTEITTVKPPMLVIEVIDEEPTGITHPEDADPVILMKPIDAIQLTPEQATFFRKHYLDDGDIKIPESENIKP